LYSSRFTTTSFIFIDVFHLYFKKNKSFPYASAKTLKNNEVYLNGFEAELHIKLSLVLEVIRQKLPTKLNYPFIENDPFPYHFKPEPMVDFVNANCKGSVK
jgi:hypothetical protein